MVLDAQPFNSGVRTAVAYPHALPVIHTTRQLLTSKRISSLFILHFSSPFCICGRKGGPYPPALALCKAGAASTLGSVPQGLTFPGVFGSDSGLGVGALGLLYMRAVSYA